MEPEPESEPVTLLVKSPNQRHRDLELTGDRSWSVGRLKAHLSRVYPERPVRGAPGDAMSTSAFLYPSPSLAAPDGQRSPGHPRRTVVMLPALPQWLSSRSKTLSLLPYGLPAPITAPPLHPSTQRLSGPGPPPQTLPSSSRCGVQP